MVNGERSAEPSVVGASVTKPDALLKVLGRASYAADITWPGMLYARVVRSPFARARIRQVDTALAAAQPGILLVLTAQDIAPGRNLVGARNRKDQLVFGDTHVNLAGEALAAVIAESPEAAQQAAEMVQLSLEPEEPLTDAERALDPGAPAVQSQGNLCHAMKIVKGDFEAALAQAALVITNTYYTQMVDHAPMEPEAAVAVPEEDGITVYLASKGPFNDRGELAFVLELPKEQVRVVVVAVGGSFGSKPDVPTIAIAALGALKTSRPVKIVLDPIPPEKAVLRPGMNVEATIITK